jgi:uncharacterized membrane protein
VLLAELTKLGGLPAHPLIVHLPVVLAPLAFIGAVLALAIKPWRAWLLPLTAALAAVSMVGAQLAVMSGEGLEELLDEESAAIERHAELGEQVRPFILAFLVFAVLAAVAWHFVHRGGADEAATQRLDTWRKLAVPFMALSVLTGALATVSVFRAGHSGAESVWEEDDGGGSADVDRPGSQDDDRPGEAPGDVRPDDDD